LKQRRKLHFSTGSKYKRKKWFNLEATSEV